MLLNTLYTLIATFSFSILANIRGKNLVFASLGGGFTWFIYLVSSNYIHTSSILCYFIASIFAAIYSETMARILKAPVTTFVISSIIPLVPGSGMYYTMSESVQGNVTMSLNLGIQTLAIAGTIAIGVFLVSSLSKTLFHFKRMLDIKYKELKNKWSFRQIFNLKLHFYFRNMVRVDTNSSIFSSSDLLLSSQIKQVLA